MKRMEQFQKEMDVMIVKATLTIIDRRSGAVGNKTFYRFGSRFPIEAVGKELGQFGYDVLGYNAEDYAEGTIDFEQLFESLQATAEVSAA
jgi:hypothetical protein